ncbi:creatininase family protein, partial [Termitidicoccus mucosus]
GARPADVRDLAFRPGNFRQPAPLPPPVLAPDPVALIDSTARHLARLLAEIDAHPPLGADPRAAASHRAPVMLPRLPESYPVSTAGSAFAAPYRARYLPALTQARLDAFADKARALVIIPTGAIEQHGRHLPVGVDAILGQAWLNHALPKLSPAAAPRVFVAPPVTCGKSNEHAGFPGTVSLSARTLRRLLLALAAHLRGLGFRHIAILNTHGGNSPVIVYTLREIQTVLGLRAGMLGLPRPADLSAQEAANGFHAGEWETALMLACAGKLVRMDRAVREHPAQVDDPGELRPGGAPAVFAWLTRDISASGVMGDATAATLKKGARWLDESSTALAHRIEELLP